MVVNPRSRMTATCRAIKGWLRMGRIGLGCCSENGYMRAPLPAARMTPTIRFPKSGNAFPLELAAHQFAHHPHRVERPDFLAFLERSPVEADRHLCKSCAALGEPRGEFGLEVEAVG